MAKIHVIDIGKLVLEREGPSSEHSISVGDDVVASFRESGFAYLKNHGIGAALQEETFAAARDFFSGDLSSKMAYERFVRTGYNGYTPIGGENNAYSSENKVDLVDFKECYDVHSLGEDYPSSVAPGFGRQMELMAAACCRLTERLLLALDATLQLNGTLPRAHVNMLHRGGCTEMRVLHYPPVPADVPGNTVRCGAHTDYGTFTLLFQDDVGGLELETSPGVWEAADPVPDTILVNIGDMMQIWTGGELRATNHRVLLPQSQHRRRNLSRQSMAFFVQPDDGVTVAPLRGDKSNYKPVDAGAFLRQQFNATYSTFAQMRDK